MGNNNLISSKKTYYISIAILAGMFFIFGFVSWVNAILIPYFRISCELTHFESYFVFLLLIRLLFPMCFYFFSSKSFCNLMSRDDAPTL